MKICTKCEESKDPQDFTKDRDVCKACVSKRVKIDTVTRYVPGENKYLDAVYEDETVWKVQGSNGLRPIIAKTEEAARRRYLKIKNPAFS